jgi:linoleoyl-CoA desaturase
MTPDAPYRGMYRFQHFYWIVFYGFLTLRWFFSDVGAYRKYRERGLNSSTGAKQVAEIVEILFYKILFVGYMVVLPMLALDLVWWQVLIGVFTVEFTAGIILSAFFSIGAFSRQI